MKLEKTMYDLFIIKQALESCDIENFKFKYTNLKNLKILGGEVDEFIKMINDEMDEETKAIHSKQAEDHNDEEKEIINEWNKKLTDKAIEMKTEVELKAYKTEWFPDNFPVQTLIIIEELIVE